MRVRGLAAAILLMFPLIAAAQTISISPDRIAYNTEGATITVTGTGLAGNVSTFVVFTNQQNGGSTQSDAISATSTQVVAEVPLSVTGLPGAWSVTVLAIDDNAQRTNGPATLTIFASLPPLINAPEVVVAEATSSSGAVVNYDVSGFSYVDPPPAPTIVCSRPSGSVFALGSTNVSCTATDSFGSSSAFLTVVVTDTTPPVLTVPAPFISSTSVVTYTATATDTVDGSITPDCSPASGSTFPTATVTTVHCSATDAHGNQSTASFQVSVLTPAPPRIFVPADFTVIADPGETGQIVAYEVTADQDAVVVCNPPSGSFFEIATTTVNCTATNAFNVQSTAAFQITVIPDPRPVLNLPLDVTVDPTSPAGAVVTYIATATDTVDGTIPVTCTPPSGSTFPIGGTLVQCSATNSRGYTRTGVFFVYVRDTTPPVLTLPANISVPSSGSPDGTVVDYTATAHDAVDGDVQANCEPISGANFPDGTTTVQCTATDFSGNSVSGSFNITVGDNVPPVIVVPANIVAEATGASGAAVTYVVTAVDNADGPVPVACTPASGSTFPLGTTTVNCSASDLAGNLATASFTVTVRDTTPPTVTVPSNITAEATSAAGAVVTFTATATDIVDGNVAVTCSPASGSTFPLGTTTVQCSATDAHGNTGHASFTVTVQDTTPPQILDVKASPSVLWPPDHKMADVTVAVTAIDLVDPNPTNQIVSVSSNQPVEGTGDGDTAPDWVITGPLTLQLRAERSFGQDRTYTITVSSTDFSGNTSTATVEVKVTQLKGKSAH